jgi:hypothetical protein
MNKILFLFSLIISISTTWGATPNFPCPANSSKVDFTSSYGGKRTVFCQTSSEGKIVKHGEEWVMRDGRVLSKNFYNYGKKGEKPQPKKVVESDPVKAKLEKVIQRFFSLFNVHPGKRVPIRTNTGGCLHNPKDRLMFMMKGVPYTQNVDYREHCFFKGSIKRAMNKELKAELELKNFYEYEKLKLQYRFTKKPTEGGFIIHANI